MKYEEDVPLFRHNWFWKAVGITIALAMLWFAAQCWLSESDEPDSEPQEVTIVETNEFLLHKWYAEFNAEYFKNRLPKDIDIDMDLHNSDMGETRMPGGKRFSLSFNAHYVAAQRVGAETLMHEMCHIKTWGEIDQPTGNHGPRWRACMLEIDQQGFNRELLIDGYREVY